MWPICITEQRQREDLGQHWEPLVPSLSTRFSGRDEATARVPDPLATLSIDAISSPIAASGISKCLQRLPDVTDLTPCNRS